jgi:hypothetical protein
MAVKSKLRATPFEKKPLATLGAIALGTVVLSFLIVDRDWYRERAHALSMAGRGTYR